MSLIQYPVWHNHDGINHWLPHLWLPLLVFITVSLVVKLPTPKQSQSTTLHISLLKNSAPKPSQQPPPIGSETKTANEPTSQQPQVEKPLNEPKTIPKPQVTQKITTQASEKTAATNKAPNTKTTPTVTTGQLFNQAQTIPDLSVTDEFKPRHTTAFKTPEIKRYDAYADIPYLPTDEDFEMDLDFYTTGIEGNIDRFFDKFIPKKSFTTKYGTKIDCALVVIVVCSWK